MIHANTQDAASAAPGGALNWIEPPTADIGGATAFFARALETCIGGRDVPAHASVAPPARDDGDVYLAVPDLAAAMAGRTAAGWRALTDIIDLPAGIGRMAHMCDAAGCRVGLHEPGVFP